MSEAPSSAVGIGVDAAPPVQVPPTARRAVGGGGEEELDMKKRMSMVKSSDDPHYGGTTAVEESLAVFTERIRSALSGAGGRLWDVGRDLGAVKRAKLYEEAGHESFKDWLGAEFPAVSYESALKMINVASMFERDDCELIGTGRAVILSARSVPPAARSRLLEAAKPAPGGGGLSCEELKEEVRKERARSGGSVRRGRPTVSPFKRFHGRVYTGAWNNDNHDVCTVPLDGDEVDRKFVAVVEVDDRGVSLAFRPG